MSAPLQPLFSLIKQGMPKRSMGIKLIVVCSLALLMTIPSFFVDSLIDDRTHRAAAVATEIGGLVGGPENFLGPTLAVPYHDMDAQGKPENGLYLVAPATGDVVVTTTTQERHRSLFKVPVYQADITFHAAFDLSGIPHGSGAVLDWDRATIVVGAADARGALADATLTSGGGSVKTFIPATSLGTVTVPDTGVPESSAVRDNKDLKFFEVPVTGLAKADAKFDVTAKMKFSGAQRLVVEAYGKTTTVAMNGDWRNPSFDGYFLPVKRSMPGNGFEASWAVPFIARGVPAEGDTNMLANLGHTAMAVSFVEMVDPYQSVTRALKYSPLFIFLIFLSYFLFEVTTGKRVHPAQYVLIGIAQTIFFVLLLSIAERIGFDFAFILSAIATVGLISIYAKWTFDSRAQGLRALAIFSLLYGLIYILLRLEDQALLVGSIASFVAIAAAMYFTRSMNWYGEQAPPPAPTGPPPAV
jgi:inner membrane protein